MTVWAAAAAAAIAVFFSGVMLFSRSLYVSALSLLVVLLQTGALFFLNGAPLLGFLQVMIYAGAVMVLVVITVMAAGGGREEALFSDFSFPRWLAWTGLVCAVVETALILAPGSTAAPLAASADLQARMSQALFKPYALAVEAVTLLMFLAALAVAPDREGAR
jgi:NADH-quinone oxidoreductase subunit J